MGKKLLLISFLMALVLCISSCAKNEPQIYGSIYGIVTDAATSEPIFGANVVLSPGGATTTTGTDGHFEYNNLTAGQYTIMAQKPPAYSTNYKQVTVVVRESVSANIPLTKIN